MTIGSRIALALALSLAVGGASQQAIMTADGANNTLPALPPLGAGIVLLSAIFGIVAWRRRSAMAVGWTAAALLAAMLVVGTAALAFGYSTWSPQLGGNIAYGLAVILNLYFLLPAAMAVAIHWLLLRRAAQA